jgi:hypothetical protein
VLFKGRSVARQAEALESVFVNYSGLSTNRIIRALHKAKNDFDQKNARDLDGSPIARFISKPRCIIDRRWIDLAWYVARCVFGNLIRSDSTSAIARTISRMGPSST